MSATVQQQILDIVAKHADVDVATLKPESTLTDMGIDSLEAIEIIFDIEEHFDITLPDRDPDFDTDTAQGLVKAVETALAAKGNATPVD
ncbi:MAG: acyl carrier protein [Rhodanobacteraceae bacterium]